MAGSKDIGFTFTWKVENFSLYYQQRKEYLESPLFKIEMLFNTEWRLLLYPRRNNQARLQLFRLQFDSRPPPIAVNVKLSISVKNGATLDSEASSFNLMSSGNILAFPIPIETINKKHLLDSEDTLIFLCRLWTINSLNPVRCVAVTQISGEKYHISLPVYYFSDNILLATGQIVLKSVSKKYPDFMIFWTSHRENVDFKIHITESKFRIFVNCRISIQELNYQKNMLVVEDHWFEAGLVNEIWTLPNIFQSIISDMKRSEEKSYKMNISLCASDTSQNSFIESITYSFKTCDAFQASDHSKVLSKQLEKMYLDEKFSDFTIISGEKEFKIHKNIFAAVSPVFCAMFELNMSEKENSAVTIDDIDSDILEKLIHFVYTGTIIDVDWDDALKIYSAADKYQILDLRKSCAKILSKKMDAENVTEALILADLHQDEMVMNTAKQVIRENDNEVFRSEKWKSFMESNSKMACKIMHEIFIH